MNQIDWIRDERNELNASRIASLTYIDVCIMLMFPRCTFLTVYLKRHINKVLIRHTSNPIGSILGSMLFYFSPALSIHPPANTNTCV